MDLLGNLNPMQRQAVTCTEGSLLLLAGAGSGKTRVITHRIAYMIQNGVDPFNILAITFTNKASKEMKERVMSLIGFDAVWVSTFHSFCVRVLRREISKIGYENSFSIYDADDSLRLIKLCIKELNLNEKMYPPKYMQNVISGAKNDLISSGEFKGQNTFDFRLDKVSACYELYQKKLISANALDFDDIIFLTVKLFQDCPDVLDRYQSRFKYIMVDEYQDTNTAQYKLIRLLARKYGNLCVVGDDDQSIYGWRGANISNILGFEKDFENASVIRLEQNYRSTKKILEAANAVISNNFSRKQKKLWTDNGAGTDIYFYKAENDMEEASFICEAIMEHKSKGASLSDTAVLYRQNSLSRSVEDYLVKNNIPYKVYGGVRFYDRKEIKDILSYLKAIYNPYDDIAYRRIINTPKRGIGDTTVEKIAIFGNQYEMSFFDALGSEECLNSIGTRSKKIREFYSIISYLKDFSQDNTVSLLIQEALEKTGYVKELEAEATDEALGRIENIDELIKKAVEFESSSEDKSLAAFLEEVSLVADIDEYAENNETVSLMTLHSSKGLEFNHVFIVGFEEGIFPSFRAVTSGDKKDLEEERRLCYVGITRAKESLYLSCASQRLQHGQIIYNSPSRFLKELPAETLMQNSYVTKYVQKSKKEETEPVKTTSSYRPKPVITSSRSNYTQDSIPAPKNKELEFGVGDSVRQLKYGAGKVLEIRPAGADYEVTIEFPGVGVKKFMAFLSKLKKI